MRRGHASARQRRLAMPSAGSVRRAHRTLSAAAAGAAIDAYDREGLIDDQEGGSRRPADQSFRRDIARGSAMGLLAFSHTVDHHGQFSLMTAQFVLIASSGLSTAAPLLLFYADAIRHRRKALRLRERKFAT